MAKCITLNCKNKARKKRLECSTCATRRYRRNNPVRYAYSALRDNSKRRGISFDLTFEQFKNFAQATDYIRGKGKTQLSYSIDRIDPEKGYTEGNLQILTLQQNSLKKNLLEKHYDGSRMRWHVTKLRSNDKTYCPF